MGSSYALEQAHLLDQSEQHSIRDSKSKHYQCFPDIRQMQENIQCDKPRGKAALCRIHHQLHVEIHRGRDREPGRRISRRRGRRFERENRATKG